MRRKMTAFLALFFFGLCAVQGARADELAELKTQLKKMQEQIRAQAKQMEEMQEKIAQLETKGTPAPERPSVAKAEKAEKDGFRAYWKENLRFETADENFDLQVGGRIQVDFAWMNENAGMKERFGDLEEHAEFRRLRVYTLGTIYKDFVYKVQVDFAGGDVGFRDVYLGMQNIPFLGLFRVGQFTEPFSLEDMTSSNHITFLERGLPYALSIHRNTGIGFSSAHFDKKLTFSASAFFNADDKALPTSTAGNFAARITGLPWYENDGEKLLHLGSAYCFRTPDDKENFRYNSEPEIHLVPDFVDTNNFRGKFANLLGLESMLIHGPLSLQGEFIQSFVNLTGTDSTGYFKGLYAFASYFLTGEHRNYNTFWANFSGVKPHNNFSLGKGGLGAWEIAARYSYLDFNTDTVSGGTLSDFTLGVNWYLNPNMKVMTNYVHANRNRVGDADIIAVRCQVYF